MTPPESSRPAVPERINGLAAIAANLAWSWNRNARALFRLLDAPLWRRTQHNPIELLRRVDPARLAACAADPAFLSLYDAVAAAAATASYRLRNAGSAAHAASRAGSTRRNSSMGLCWVRRHSGASSRRNRARALRFQLHARLAAMAASPLIRSGTAGRLDSGGVIAPAS